jgi:hypothetical protein
MTAVDFLALVTLGLLITSIVLTFKKHTNKSVFWIATVVSLIGFGLISPDTEVNQPASSKTIDSKPVKTNKKDIIKSKNNFVKPEDNLAKILSDTLDKKVTVTYWKKDCVMIKFPIDDNLFRDSIIRGGQKDIITILSEYKKVVWDKDASICISGTFPAIDQYGNINKNEVAMMVAIDYNVLLKMNLGNMQMNPKLLDNDIYYYTLMAYMKN